MENEDFQKIAEHMKSWFEDGGCQKELEPSLLGLDWSSFVTRKFTEDDRDIRFMNPPEFIYYGFSALDAYATAILGAGIRSNSPEALTVRCKLTEASVESGLQLRLSTLSEHGQTVPNRIMLKLLRSFPQMLKAKNIESGAVLFLEGDGCPMTFKYPGRMKSNASGYLRDRPKDLWPEVILTLMPTEDLELRARQISAFLNEPDSTEGTPN